MARYVRNLTLNKEPAQVEDRVRHFLMTYDFKPSKKGNWFEKGKGFWSAKRNFSYRYVNGVLTYEAWLNKNMDPSDGKFTGSMIKKAYMAELASFEQFILGNVGELPPVTYSPNGTYVGLAFTILTILLCIAWNQISLMFPFLSLILTIPNGTKSKAKVLAYIVIILDVLLLVYWLLSVVLGVAFLAGRL